MSDLISQIHTEPSRQVKEDALYALLTDLFTREVENFGDTKSWLRDYVSSRLRKNAIHRAIDAFKYYLPYLPSTGNILDWGCGLSAEACMMRYCIGSELDLYGCDLGGAERFPVLRGYSGIRYQQLNHPYQLPYEDNFFDVLLGNGVLEHVMMDNESLKEIRRVLRPDGLLVITFLPNRYSYTEFMARKLKRGGHQRLYTKNSIEEQLRHQGFLPLVSRYHQFIPAATIRSASSAYIDLIGRFWRLNRILERAWPTKVFCTNLMVIARAVTTFY